MGTKYFIITVFTYRTKKGSIFFLVFVFFSFFLKSRCSSVPPLCSALPVTLTRVGEWEDALLRHREEEEKVEEEEEVEITDARERLAKHHIKPPHLYHTTLIMPQHLQLLPHPTTSALNPTIPALTLTTTTTTTTTTRSH
ncbi:hypothetical protein E2C01_092328 [Portunus trituberculatus]|uniref:Uncharacterized protein n=1 Tax=Portunus trituberculatus TaxID=210409 RepID=A0A5B7JJT4_PORTR|nr:hypothetical protein [Portunus trituberculatus]